MKYNKKYLYKYFDKDNEDFYHYNYIEDYDELSEEITQDKINKLLMYL